MPNQDLTITEGKIVAWLKEVGDVVSKGEAVVEVETDKAVMTVESPVAGRLTQILAQQQETVLLGQTLAIIEPSEP